MQAYLGVVCLHLKEIGSSHLLLVKGTLEGGSPDWFLPCLAEVNIPMFLDMYRLGWKLQNSPGHEQSFRLTHATSHCTIDTSPS